VPEALCDPTPRPSRRGLCRGARCPKHLTAARGVIQVHALPEIERIEAIEARRLGLRCCGRRGTTRRRCGSVDPPSRHIAIRPNIGQIGNIQIPVGEQILRSVDLAVFHDEPATNRYQRPGMTRQADVCGAKLGTAGKQVDCFTEQVRAERRNGLGGAKQLAVLLAATGFGVSASCRSGADVGVVARWRCWLLGTGSRSGPSAAIPRAIVASSAAGLAPSHRGQEDSDPDRTQGQHSGRPPATAFAVPALPWFDLHFPSSTQIQRRVPALGLTI